MANKMLVDEYFQWLENTVDKNSDLYKLLNEYLERQQAPAEHKGPFLSIITRTQGKRKHMLAETLLCLEGQSNLDFELLIMTHNLNQEQALSVDSIVNDTPKWMREKIRVIPVEGGSRATPLNIGFQEAKGKYFAILDDDDLVFDNWVDEFYKLAQENDGKILHSFVVRQDWEVVGENKDIPRACGAPDNTHCQSFQMRRQLIVNNCPLFSLAFPAYAFRELGIRFNETLNTTEDWDFLMRMAVITGVADAQVVTGIYRIWKNTENSQTLHNKKEWDKNYGYIVDRFKTMPVVLLPRMREEAMGKMDSYDFSLRSEDNELYYNEGLGYSEKCVIKGTSFDDENEEYCILFEFDKDAQPIYSLRLDPKAQGGFSITDFKLKIVFESGREQIHTVNSMHTNGLVLRGKEIAFIKNDPQMALAIKNPEKIKAVYVGYELHDPIEDKTVDRIFAVRNFLPRCFAFAVRKMKGALRRIKNVLK